MDRCKQLAILDPPDILSAQISDIWTILSDIDQPDVLSNNGGRCIRPYQLHVGHWNQPAPNPSAQLTILDLPYILSAPILDIWTNLFQIRPHQWQVIVQCPLGFIRHIHVHRLSRMLRLIVSSYLPIIWTTIKCNCWPQKYCIFYGNNGLFSVLEHFTSAWSARELHNTICLWQ